MASIQEFRRNIKLFLGEDAVFYSLVIVFIALISFGLGRLSSGTEATLKPQISLSEAAVTLAVPSETVEVTSSTTAASDTPLPAIAGKYVGSRKGTKYHLPWCPGASQMKEENKVWFATEAEAKAAGYTPAANCKGL